MPARPDAAYRPRSAEGTLLHRVVSEQLEPFLARARARGQPAPRFVEQELGSFLRCGVLAPCRCPRCGATLRLVAAIEDSAVARQILECMGLPARAPPVGPATPGNGPDGSDGDRFDDFDQTPPDERP